MAPASAPVPAPAKHDAEYPNSPRILENCIFRSRRGSLAPITPHQTTTLPQRSPSTRHQQLSSIPHAYRGRYLAQHQAGMSNTPHFAARAPMLHTMQRTPCCYNLSSQWMTLPGDAPRPRSSTPSEQRRVRYGVYYHQVQHQPACVSSPFFGLLTHATTP